MTKITAAEARKLAGPSVEDHVAEAFEAIRAAATVKHREARLHNDFWVNEGYSRTRDWQDACALLTKEGFTVEFFYEERQFVDMYTIVKW